jgi:formylglycine-generating enzyme required for sulfatase activity
MRFQWVSGLPDGGVWPGGGLISQNGPGGFVGQFEVTQSQYMLMNGSNPSAFQGQTNSNYPVENLSWKQADDFCKWLTLNDPKKPAGWVYALPTEAQYVFYGADADLAGQVSSVGRAAAKRAHPEEVGSTRKPNKFRLHDVVGNVSEWVATPGVYRGGSFQTSAQYKIGVSAREANRELDPSVGFRIILVPQR